MWTPVLLGSLVAPAWFTFWHGGSLGHIDGEIRFVVIQYHDSSYFLQVRLEECLIRITLSLFTWLVLLCLHFAHLHRGYYPSSMRWAGCIWSSRGSAMTPQTLFCLEGYRLSGYLWPPMEMNIANEP